MCRHIGWRLSSISSTRRCRADKPAPSSALLALLAASGERGLSRDQLLAYLWPESAAANARHSLDQLLHALRRALGESVFSGTNPVSLDSGVVASDVTEFERALAQCKPEDFDGHTEFYRLTPEQRLEWLCEAATFVYEFKGKANSGAGN